MKRFAVLAVGILALTGCATPAPETPPEPVVIPGPYVPVPPATPPDTCGLAAVKDLVGRPRTEVPVPLNPALQRVACTTCPVTMDYNPNRLNFFFDAQTGLIKEIKCG